MPNTLALEELDAGFTTVYIQCVYTTALRQLELHDEDPRSKMGQ
jgi:hypothetical protein